MANDTLNYISPVDHQIRLTGNFMEIRNNHFHSGIDIKSSSGRSGDIIRAVQNGFVSRVKIQSGSYGNALYIDHPSTGHTSVYAHLSEFDEEIAAFVKKIQYNTESFEVDIYLPDSLITVARGQQIGKMGNTGRSFGPHLHFELRDTETEEPINPEMLGLGPTDNRAPVIENMSVYELNDDYIVQNKSIKYFKSKGTEYKLHDNVLEIGESHVAFGLHMHDYMDGSYNKNGVFGYRVFVDGTLDFQWEADRYNFNENRLLNGFIDYQRRKDFGHKVYLLYQQSCNDFSGYSGQGTGIIAIDSTARKIKLEVYDLYNNESSIEFSVRKSENSSNARDSQDYLSCSEAYKVSTQNFTINIDSTDLFESMVVDAKESTIEIGGKSYPSIRIGQPTHSPKSYYSLDINGLNYKPADKWTLIHINNRGQMQDFGLKYDNSTNRIYSEVDVFGQFVLLKDETAPQIDVVNIDTKRKRPWIFRISDNLSPDGRLPDLYYRAEVNGQWVRMNYDLKSDQLIFNDFDKLPNTSFEFKLIVRDNCGNESIWQRVFKNV